MSESSATELSREVRDRTLDYLWRQWRTIGATVSGSAPANVIVDPEALILTSLWMLDHERRLVDVTASWVRVNSALLSIQRLSNLRDDFPKVVTGRLSALARVGVDEAKDSRWKSLSERTADDLGSRDNKVRAVEARLSSWATLMLQLRRGMGVGAKADVLTFLLGTSLGQAEWASVATIAEATGYTRAAVRRVADDLAAARFIRVPGSAESERSLQRMYSTDQAQWAQLLRIGTYQPGWGYWRERFLFVIELMTWLESLADRRVTAYARNVEARAILTRHGAALRRDRVVDPLEFAGADLDMAYLEKASRALLEFFQNSG